MEFEKFRHENKMEELRYMRETAKLQHAWALEMGRIKNAEIRKTQEREMHILDIKKDLRRR